MKIKLILFFVCMMLIMSFTSVNAISYLWNFTGDGEGWEFSYGEGANFADNNFKSGSDSSGAFYYYNITSPFGFPLNYSLNYVSGGGNQMRMGIHNESAVISLDSLKFVAFFYDGAGDIYTISNEITLYICDNDDNFFSDGDIVGLYMPNSFEVEYYSNGVLVCNYTSETPLIDSSDIFLFLGSRTDLVILDDVKFEYNDLPLCILDWVCDGYDNCMTNNTQNCNSVVDNNSCGELYAGDYSEFTPQVCTYTSPVENVGVNPATSFIYIISFMALGVLLLMFRFYSVRTGNVSMIQFVVEAMVIVIGVIIATAILTG